MQITCGAGIRYTVPSYIHPTAQSATLRFRVNNIYSNVQVIIKAGDTQIYCRKHRILVPGEMVSITLDKEKLSQCTACSKLTVCLQEV